MIPTLSEALHADARRVGACRSSAGRPSTLYGTIFAATAAHSRVYADLCRIMGFYQRDDYQARLRYRRGFVWALTLAPVRCTGPFRSR